MIYRSRNGKIIIEYVRREDSILIAKGRVKPTGRPGLFHKVKIVYSFQKKYLVDGSCDCEISNFYGICKHQLALLYVTIKAEKKLYN